MQHTIGAPRARTQWRSREKATLPRLLRARMRVTLVIIAVCKECPSNRYSLTLGRIS
jgi:hypothetical protein